MGGVQGRVRRRAALALCAAVLGVCLPSLCAAAESEGRALPVDPAQPTPAYDDVARFLAGLPVDGGPLAPRQQRATWVEHGRAMDERWRAFEGKQLARMRGFAARELAPRSDADRVLLYPFSGPDLINMTTLFPGRPGYVMLSLEPTGAIPDLAAFDEADFDRFFAMLQQSLHSIFRWDFFQTVDLRRDLSVPGLEGVLPLLLLFAARDGLAVQDVHYLFVAPDGSLVEIPAGVGAPPEGDGVPGVRLALQRRGSDAILDVRYFSVDLGSYSVEQKRAFFARLAERAPFTTFLKAASYLMFKPKYRAIERFVLEHSRDVLQDDSGVPFADLLRGGWNVALFGSYERPIGLFADMLQEDLAAAYRERSDVRPLPFPVGYKVRPRESTLMHATRGPR